MANDDHLKKLKEGVDAWNLWREENPDITPDLKKAVLQKIDLQNANLSHADLSGADLLGADLSEAVFENAILKSATIALAKLQDANLNKADLRKADLRKANLNKANLSGADLSGADLSKANFSEADLSNALLLKKVDLREANLSGAVLHSSKLTNALLNNATLKFANLKAADLSKADLSAADISDASLSGTNLSEANLKGAILTQSYLGKVNFYKADLSGADLSETDLSEADFGEADLKDAKFRGAKFTHTDLSGIKNCPSEISKEIQYDEDHAEEIKKGPESWKSWREKNPETRPNLHHHDLSGSNLSGIDLKNAVLWSSKFSNADLSNADLSNADLFKANLRGANLQEALLNGANLSNADLIGADLRGADLSSANLSNTDLSYARLQKADLSKANLQGAILDYADFSGTAIFGAKLDSTIKWRSAKFSCDPKHLEKLREGVEQWNEWRKKNPDVIPVLRGADLRDADLEGADLSNAELWYVDLREAKFNGAKFTNAILKEADLRWADLCGADLSDADLWNADLRDAIIDKTTKITKASFKGAVLSDSAKNVFDWGEADFGGRDDHVEKLREGAESWNNWRNEYPYIVPILRGASLKKIDLSGAIDLRNADLWNANLYGAQLESADLRNAYLRNADLREAKLSGADLNGANLNETDLWKANLSPKRDEQAQDDNGQKTNLSNAILRDADLNEANFKSANLYKADLRGVDFTGSDLTGADVSRANLCAANLKGAKLKNTVLKEAILNQETTFDSTNLSGADLRGVDFNNIDLSKAKLTGAILRDVKNVKSEILDAIGFNPEHLEKLEEGSEAWNKWRDENPNIIPVLRKVVLSGKGFNLRNYNLREADLSNAILEGVDLSGANLRYANLEKAILSNAKLNNTKLREADLSEARLDGADLRGARIIGATLHKANLSYVNCTEHPAASVESEPGESDLKKEQQSKKNHHNSQRTVFISSDLSEANLAGANLEEADFSEARLDSADLSNAILTNADFRNAYLASTIFSNANLNGAKFGIADLSSAKFSFIQDQLDRLSKGARKWNAWRKNHPDIKVILRDADLNEKDLRKFNLYDADLREANLGGTDLRDADLHGADLSGAMLRKVLLRRADLRGVNFNAANLREADLSETKLSGANFTKADLGGADLSGADLRSPETGKTILVEADLREADIYGANLYKADLSKANLTQANLSRANLREADLNETDLRRANLSGANLRDAKLDKANLSGANLIGAQYNENDLKDNDPKGDYSKYDWIRTLMDEIKEGNITIRNRTARRIEIVEDQIVLPPFGERQITLNEYTDFRNEIDKWKRSSLITLDVNTLDPDQQIRFQRSSKYAAKSLIGKFWNMLRWLFAYMGAKMVRFFKWFPQSFKLRFIQLLSFVPVLIIGIGLPAATIYWFGGGQELLAPGTPFSLAHLARALQFLFIVITALLPVLLYFLFDRQQLGTLRENFYRNVLELDSKIMTLDDAKSIYGVRVSEVYGPEDLPGGKKQLLQQVTRLPILVATLVITLGWIITLMPVGSISGDFTIGELYKFLTPGPEAINYGFLGAYFFSINMIIRRYTRADLKPKTYSHITVRFLVVTILVWVLSLLPRFGSDAADDPRSVLMVLAFMVGIVPETALTIIREFLQKSFGKAIPSLEERLPLTALDGITIYEKARLQEEGIENIENLVHIDLIDLMLQTRIPLARLIDWVDQGLLHLHLWSELGEKDEAEKVEPALVTLRRYGIRNSSDLIEIYNRAVERDKISGSNNSHENVNQLLAILPADPGKLRPLASIYDALQNDEWLGNIIRWRSRSSLPGERAYTLEEMYKTFDELIKENDSAPMSTTALVGNGNRAAQRSEESSIQTGRGVEPAETVSANTNSVPETDSQPQESDQSIREDEATQ